MKSASTKFFEVATVLSSEIHAENIVFNKMNPEFPRNYTKVGGFTPR
jgi:hypothetical protein